MNLLHVSKFYQYLVVDIFIKFNSTLGFPDPEPQIIKILQGWSGIYGQFGL